MRAVVSTACLAAVLALLAPSTSAQWARYPTRNVPKDAKGQPDMNAPAPRTADGKPDPVGPLARRRLGPREGRGAADAPPAVRTAGCRVCQRGSEHQGGTAAHALRRRAPEDTARRNSKDNPEAHCLPMGIIQLHTQGAPRKFIQTPLELVILYEPARTSRDLHRRPALPSDDPQPWYNGYSVGRWEGDTLVVETVQFRDGGWLDINGSPLTDAGESHRAFSPAGVRRMEIDVTIEDKKAYTKPF
jgi:hypothetical protein